MYNQTILLGVIISLIYAEITGFSAGLILSGYLALNLHNPGRVLCTLAVSLAAMGLCRLLSRGLILYGRRRFALLLLLSVAISALVNLWGLLPFSALGIVLPGLIAREFDRQGIINTLLSLTVTTALTALCMLLLGGSLIL